MTSTTEQKTEQTTKTPPRYPEEARLGGLTVTAAQDAAASLGFERDFVATILGVGPSRADLERRYAGATREQLGLPASTFLDEFNRPDLAARERVLAGLRARGVAEAAGPFATPSDVVSATPARLTQDLSMASVEEMAALGFQPVGGGNVMDSNTGEVFPASGIPTSPSPVAGGGSLAAGRLSDEERRALQEIAQEQTAFKQFIQGKESELARIPDLPITKLVQSQIAQETAMLPIRQATESANLAAIRAQSDLSRRFAEEVAPLNLDYGRREAQLALDRQGTLAPLETNLARLGLDTAQTSLASGRAAEQALMAGLVRDALSEGKPTPEEEALIWGQAEQAIGRTRNDYLRQFRNQMIEEAEGITARGLRGVQGRAGAIDTLAADRYGRLAEETMRQGGQAVRDITGAAYNQLLNRPLQRIGTLGNLNLQQQYLTNQYQSRYGPALATSTSLRSGGGQFPGYASEAARIGAGSYRDPLTGAGSALALNSPITGGLSFGIAAQQPYAQDRFSNQRTTGMSTVDQTMSGMDFTSKLLGGLGSAAQGVGGGMLSYRAAMNPSQFFTR